MIAICSDIFAQCYPNPTDPYVHHSPPLPSRYASMPRYHWAATTAWRPSLTMYSHLLWYFIPFSQENLACVCVCVSLSFSLALRGDAVSRSKNSYPLHLQCEGRKIYTQSSLLDADGKMYSRYCNPFSITPPLAEHSNPSKFSPSTFHATFSVQRAWSLRVIAKRSHYTMPISGGVFF